MPYKSGTLKGQLTTAEIRKLVRAHNKLSKITIPPKSSRDEILTIISKAGFRVNHEKQLLEQLKKMDISVEKAKVVTKPVKKTEEQKQQAKAKKDAKVKEQKTKEAELIKKGAVIGKLVAKKQMAKEQKKVVKKDLSTDDTEKFKKVWDSVKDLNWKENVRTQILTLFNTGNRVPANKTYHIIKDVEIKGNKLIIKHVFTRERAEEVLERDKGESSEEEVVKLMTKPTTARFTIPKGKELKGTSEAQKKKEVPYIISKIKDSNAKLYDYNFMKEKDIVEWFNNWKRDRRTLIRELKVALSKGVVTKEDLKPVEPININRTKEYKIREAQIFRAIKEQEQKN